MDLVKEHMFCGIHVLGELYGVSAELLDDVDLLEETMREGVKRSGASLCGVQVKRFDPSGVTLLALLSESHASIHTYPDEGALFIDAFTCGKECRPQRIVDEFVKLLHPDRKEVRILERGDFKSDLNSMAAKQKETSLPR